MPDDFLFYVRYGLDTTYVCVCPLCVQTGAKGMPAVGNTCCSVFDELSDEHALSLVESQRSRSAIAKVSVQTAYSTLSVGVGRGDGPSLEIMQRCVLGGVIT